MVEQSQERRRFQRIEFTAEVELSQGGKTWQAQLEDISLKGLLVKRPPGCYLEQDVLVAVVFRLSDNTVINMRTCIAHATNDYLGLQRATIDLESITHLRRLIELNLGDPEAAERELTEMIDRE